jgi:hypothetical protein
MHPQTPPRGGRHQLASFVCASVLLALLVTALATCSDSDLVVPGSIRPTIAPTETPDEDDGDDS